MVVVKFDDNKKDDNKGLPAVNGSGEGSTPIPPEPTESQNTLNGLLLRVNGENVVTTKKKEVNFQSGSLKLAQDGEGNINIEADIDTSDLSFDVIDGGTW